VRVVAVLGSGERQRRIEGRDRMPQNVAFALPGRERVTFCGVYAHNVASPPDRGQIATFCGLERAKRRDCAPISGSLDVLPPIGA
jgi:hypothetical protein